MANRRFLPPTLHASKNFFPQGRARSALNENGPSPKKPSYSPAVTAYCQLGAAILLEVAATACLKQSAGMTRLLPTWPLGWAIRPRSGCWRRCQGGAHGHFLWHLERRGIVLVSLVGLFLFGQKLDLAACLGLGLIIAGVLVINFFSASVPR